MTRKQQRFIEEYLIDLNASQAALRAGYSERSAHAIGRENMRKPTIAAAIKAAMDELAARNAITADKVIAMLEDSRAKADKAGQNSAAIRAAELLGKHTGMFTDKVRITGKDDGPIEVELSAKEICRRMAFAFASADEQE